jgi:hypothetical protein
VLYAVSREGPAAMPKSKHRRKRAKASSALPPLPEGSDLPELESDLELDPEFAAALAQAEEELAAEIAAAEAGESGPYLDDDDDDEEFDDAIAPLLQAVEEQVRTNQPPEVAATLGRLVASGHDRDEAISLIGAVLMFELNEVMQNDRAFDPARYAARLAALPRLPDLD